MNVVLIIFSTLGDKRYQDSFKFNHLMYEHSKAVFHDKKIISIVVVYENICHLGPQSFDYDIISNYELDHLQEQTMLFCYFLYSYMSFMIVLYYYKSRNNFDY